MQYETLTLGFAAGIAQLRLERPASGNAIDARCFEELTRVLAQIRDDGGVRVVLLSAAGADFCSGGAPRGAEAAGMELPFRDIELLPQPVIACIQGRATGAGLELALACDIRIAAHDAVFAAGGLAADSMPSLGGTQRLPRLIGRGKASEMILLGEPLDAEAALACGLVNAVVPVAELHAHGAALAERIAAQGPIAVRYAKEAILRGLDMPLEQALRYETDLTIILQTTEDRAEGVAAFLEKRPPRFTGA
jgi:enoyl-CoA hydratase